MGSVHFLELASLCKFDRLASQFRGCLGQGFLFSLKLSKAASRLPGTLMATFECANDRTLFIALFTHAGRTMGIGPAALPSKALLDEAKCGYCSYQLSFGSISSSAGRAARPCLGPRSTRDPWYMRFRFLGAARQLHEEIRGVLERWNCAPWTWASPCMQTL